MNLGAALGMALLFGWAVTASRLRAERARFAELGDAGDREAAERRPVRYMDPVLMDDGTIRRVSWSSGSDSRYSQCTVAHPWVAWMGVMVPPSIDRWMRVDEVKRRRVLLGTPPPWTSLKKET